MSYNDAIYVKSTRAGPEIMASFCHNAFDDFVLNVVGTIDNRRTTVNRSPFSIDAFPIGALEVLRRWRLDKYGFVPNLLMPIFYSKSEEIWVKNNGEWDLPPLRDVILKGVVGLIATSEDSIALFLDNPERDVLIRHDGELTLLQDPFWTKDRLLLFKDIPYTVRRVST